MIETVLSALIISSPIWIAMAFGAYAIGRRHFTIALLLIFMAAESLSLVVAMAALHIVEELHDIPAPD